MPTGRLTRKIDCQETCSSRRPPIVGPKIGARTIGTPIALITFGRFRGPAALTRIIWPVGTSMPPPIPWITRKATSDSTEFASPQSTEPAVKRTSETM